MELIPKIAAGQSVDPLDIIDAAYNTQCSSLPPPHIGVVHHQVDGVRYDNNDETAPASSQSADSAGSALSYILHSVVRPCLSTFGAGSESFSTA